MPYGRHAPADLPGDNVGKCGRSGDRVPPDPELPCVGRPAPRGAAPWGAHRFPRAGDAPTLSVAIPARKALSRRAGRRTGSPGRGTGATARRSGPPAHRPVPAAADDLAYRPEHCPAARAETTAPR